jgi:hypothetical protein
VLTWRGLVTYYVLFFIHLDSRRVSIAGITDHPETCWMRQVACNATLEGMGHLNGCRGLLRDRDAKFCAEFRATLAAGGVKGLRLPPRSPNLNAFAERWVRSVKEECLSHLILFGERSLRKALIQFQEHYHAERNHQGKSNVPLFPAPAPLEPGQRRGIAVENVLAAYSDTTVATHEYFDQTRYVNSARVSGQGALFGERSLRKALTSSKSIITKNATIKARTTLCSSLPLLGFKPGGRRGIRCRERLGGLFRYYSRAA